MILSIVIPVFNNINFTKSCLQDLILLDSNHEIIVIDNCSTDNTEETCSAFVNESIRNRNFGKETPLVRYYKNESNLGFAKAVNQGYSYSSGTNVLFLNNDIRVQSNYTNWTEDLIRLSSDSIVGPTGGYITSHGDFIKETDRLDDNPNTIFYMSGWCLCSSKKNWNKLIINNYSGPFTEEFTTYFEDTDLSIRARELGIELKLQHVPVIHFGKMTSRKVGLSSLYSSAKGKFRKKWNM